MIATFIGQYEKWITILAHTCGSLLGLLALWGLMWHRKKIGAFARLLAHSAVSEQATKIRRTLTQLEKLNYDKKSARSEIIALLGELAGNIERLASRHEDFKRVHDELISFTTTPQTLSESNKRRVAGVLHGLLSEKASDAALDLIEVSNGPKNTRHS